MSHIHPHMLHKTHFMFGIMPKLHILNLDLSTSGSILGSSRKKTSLRYIFSDVGMICSDGLARRGT
jgi:hypothetical protein